MSLVLTLEDAQYPTQSHIQTHPSITYLPQANEKEEEEIGPTMITHYLVETPPESPQPTSMEIAMEHTSGLSPWMNKMTLKRGRGDDEEIEEMGRKRAKGMEPKMEYGKKEDGMLIGRNKRKGKLKTTRELTKKMERRRRLMGTEMMNQETEPVMNREAEQMINQESEPRVRTKFEPRD